MIRINLIRTRKARRRDGGERALIVMGAAVLAALAVMAVFTLRAGTELDGLVRANNAINRLTVLVQSVKISGQCHGPFRIARCQQFHSQPRLTPHKGPTFDRDSYEERLRRDPNVGFNSGWDPRRLWLDSYEEAQRKVKIRGAARTNEDVAEFLKRLQLSVFFGDVTPESTTQVAEGAAGGGAKHVTFNVSARVVY